MLANLKYLVAPRMQFFFEFILTFDDHIIFYCIHKYIIIILIVCVHVFLYLSHFFKDNTIDFIKPYILLNHKTVIVLGHCVRNVLILFYRTDV